MKVSPSVSKRVASLPCLDLTFLELCSPSSLLLLARGTLRFSLTPLPAWEEVATASSSGLT